MFRQTGPILRSCMRQVHTHATASPARKNGYALAAGLAIGGTAICYTVANPTFNDATLIVAPPLAQLEARRPLYPKTEDPSTLHTLAWGSNSDRTLSPSSSPTETLRHPAIAKWLEGVALRDMQLHERYGACVDARGDVYQWGDGFYGPTLSGEHPPKRTLKNKNIVQLQLTEEKVYALSASGRVYCFSSSALKQGLRPGAPTPASDSWWGTGWLWGEDEDIDFVEVMPTGALAWREKFTSLAAGDSHVLALTSKGRVFAHPVNKRANLYGQLGFRKFSIPDHAAKITHRDSHMNVELIPKSLADPYLKQSQAVRVNSDAFASDNLSNVDDKPIRFCPYLFEIPVLKEIEAAQIAAGGRTSFVRTPTGRVLGWGANEHGQVGLGSSVSLDTITVPTEVILWRFVRNNVQSKCLNVVAGGDLTSFVVQRLSEQGPNTTDLLMCGNGQYGGLGNNTFTNNQGNPSRVKAVSGLLQYNEAEQGLEAIQPDEISISHTGHILLSLASNPDINGVGGRDLLVWGRNNESELGNGKRSNAVFPTPVQSPDEHERFMLREKKAKEVKDLAGVVWKRGVKVKQQVVSGFNNSVVYWKIVN